MLLLIQEYSGKLSFDTAGRSVRRSVRNVFLKRDLSGKPIARKDNGIFSRRRCGNGKVARLYRITAVKIIVPVGYLSLVTVTVNTSPASSESVWRSVPLKRMQLTEYSLSVFFELKTAADMLSQPQMTSISTTEMMIKAVLFIIYPPSRGSSPQRRHAVFPVRR